MNLFTWLSLLAICCFGAMSPGPSLAIVLKHSVNGGRINGLVASWAHALGVGLWALATVTGLALLVKKSPELYTGLTWAGAVYLAWLGIQALRSGTSKSMETSSAPKTTLAESAREGGLISILNPKLAIFFIALFSQFVSTDAVLLDQTIMIATATLVDGIWYSLVCLVLSQSRVLTFLQANSHWVNRATGIILIVLALRVITL